MNIHSRSDTPLPNFTVLTCDDGTIGFYGVGLFLDSIASLVNSEGWQVNAASGRNPRFTDTRDGGDLDCHTGQGLTDRTQGTRRILQTAPGTKSYQTAHRTEILLNHLWDLQTHGTGLTGHTGQGLWTHTGQGTYRHTQDLEGLTDTQDNPGAPQTHTGQGLTRHTQDRDTDTHRTGLCRHTGQGHRHTGQGLADTHGTGTCRHGTGTCRHTGQGLADTHHRTGT
ncbi:hypothetical protein AVEN_118487-1 [Araneus ventricosus]|uniref:Uncharacterized protein n=1 Tax=Araneus ventricosus TaxID=182803 RepID=A0A4Y2UKY6_ARAVE|nr:hypothetical protein AVEN_118487-1 [Araneus ventricosus]